MSSPYRLAHRGERVEIYEPVLLLRQQVISIDDHARVDSWVKLEGGEGLQIGKYVHIASFAHINIGGGTVELGDYSAVASGGKIIGGSNRPEGLSMSAAAPLTMQVVTRSKVIVGAYACVLTNAVLMPGVTLGEGAVVGAGAVVTKDIPAWEIWAGVPARKISERPRPARMPQSPALDWAALYLDYEETRLGLMDAYGRMGRGNE